MKEILTEEKKKNNSNLPLVLQRIVSEKRESDSDAEKSTWSAAWCTDTISD